MKIGLLLVTALLFSACGNDSKDVEKQTAMKVSTTISTKQVQGQYELLFFLNPHGAPCQMQTSILKGMGEDLTSRAEIRYIKTTEMETARPLFMKYGVRALPSLIVLDDNGNVHHRFPPGIQAKESILEKIGG